MKTLLIALASGVGFIVAYNTYGRWMARKIFGLDPNALVPSKEMEDGIDYVPTRRSVVFGHHFTSIAGTGPIVGPAIAVFWGWLPALLWVVFGSIFVGAVHDFGALVVSLRSRGQTIGDVAGRMISPRARVLFLFILFVALSIVLGVFGLVIAVIFSVYPQTVFSIWIELPMAIALGWWVMRRGGGLLWPSLAALVLVYFAVYIGAYHLPLSMDSWGVPLFAGTETTFLGSFRSQVVIWTIVLLVYCFFASTLPVWTLLQPRDYINSHKLIVGLALLMLGLFVARPEFVAPAISDVKIEGAPFIFPFLFITIACGAVSGFHCLVSSGTSSKQIKSETDAQFVGYGSMLVEGALAVVVIIACAAGLGMGVYDTTGGVVRPMVDAAGAPLLGQAAWNKYYAAGTNWADFGLAQMVGAFIEGAANIISAIGIPIAMSIAIVAVMVASFAATTLDTATRLQRYVVQELGAAVGVTAVKNKYAATTVAVVAGGALALMAGPRGPGSGGMILWPLFGAVNQLLAGLAFMVIAFYLIRHKRPIGFLALPGLMMVFMPFLAMSIQIRDWFIAERWLLFGMGVGIEALQVWMLYEGFMMWSRAKGVLPEPLPPLEPALAGVGAGPPRERGGRSC